MRSVLRSLWKIAVLAGALCTTCAFEDRHGRLRYPAEPEASAVAVSASAAERVVHLGLVVDSRTVRGRIGELLNAFGMNTANVVTEDGVAAWVGHGARRELERAGFTVLMTPPETGRIEVAGELLEVRCSASPTLSSCAGLPRISATRPNLHGVHRRAHASKSTSPEPQPFKPPSTFARNPRRPARACVPNNAPAL